LTYRQIAKDGPSVCDLKPILKKYGFGDLPVYPNTGRKEENSEPLMSISSREYHLFYDERMTSLEMRSLEISSHNCLMMNMFS
jgi:hypothetical protein